jgi:hypothetical protein
VTTGIIPKGRTDTTTLTLPRRIAVTLAIGAGLALAIVRLWHTLAAEVGARTRLPRRQQEPDTTAEPGITQSVTRPA